MEVDTPIAVGADAVANFLARLRCRANLCMRFKHSARAWIAATGRCAEGAEAGFERRLGALAQRETLCRCRRARRAQGTGAVALQVLANHAAEHLVHRY